MNRVCLVLLSSLFVCFAFSVRSNAAKNEVYNIQDSKPGKIVSGVANQTILFQKNTPAGISFSAVMRNGKKLSNALKYCTIKNADTNTVLMNLYDFVSQDVNTKSYNSSVLVDCTEGDATSAVFLAQSQRDLVIFDSYKVYDGIIPTDQVTAAQKSVGITLLTTDLADIYVVGATFTFGQSFKYGLGTPEVTPKYTINSTNSFPYLIPYHQMATTFYFNGANLQFDIRGGYIPMNCTGTTIVDQNVYGTNTFSFPGIGAFYRIGNSQTVCRFQIKTTGLKYIPVIQMEGQLSRNTIVKIYGNNGFGVVYASNDLSAQDDNYRGDTLPSLYYLPSDGYVDVIADLNGVGYFSLNVSFIEAKDYRQNLTSIFLAQTVRVNLDDLKLNQYQMFSTNAGAPQISLSIAPSETRDGATADYDYCFLNILKDKSPFGIPTARYSLRQFTQALKPIYFQNGIITCQKAINMYGFLLLRLNTAFNFDRYGSTLARVGTTVDKSYFFPRSNFTNILTMLVEDQSQDSLLTHISDSQDNELVIHSRGETGDVVEKVHRSNLPVRTHGAMTTYEANPNVNYLTVRVTNSGGTLIFNSLLLLFAGYFLH